MCMVSAVFPQVQPFVDGVFPYPTSEDKTTLRMLREVLEKLDKLDKRMELRECKVEEPIKEALMEKIRKVLDEK